MSTASSPHPSLSLASPSQREGAGGGLASTVQSLPQTSISTPSSTSQREGAGGGLASTDQSRPDRSTLFPLSRFAFWFWLSGLIICMGWDRAAWLLVSSAGVPKLEWLERAARPGALLSALTSVRSLSAAAELVLAGAYSAIYFFGRIWIWLVLAIVIIFRSWASTDVARVRRGLRHAVFVALVPALAGVAAELFKLISRRQRPELSDGFYTFRAPAASPLDPDFWSTTGLGLASSHAAVAVAAALAAGVLFPRVRWPLLIMALLCSLSRVAVGAHYLSDVYIGATLALLIFALIYAWDRRNNAGRPIAP